MAIAVHIANSTNLNCSSGALKEIEKCNANLPEITSPNDTITSVDGSTMPTSFQELHFEVKIVHYLPKGIAKFFPQLMTLNVLKSIQADDLEGLTHLKVLYVWGNDITELSSDLFKFTPQITEISFPSNLISRVGKNLLANVSTLHKMDFRCNKCIDGDTILADFETIKKELKMQCPDPKEFEKGFCPEDLERYESDIGELQTAMKLWIPTCSVYFEPEWTNILRNRTAKLEECSKFKAIAEELS